MITKDYTIHDPLGMHARPATNILKLSRQYKSAIFLKKDNKKVQLKSMLNILSLAIKCGDKISLIIEGEDESDASLAFDSFFSEELKNK
jgi:phosphocarrier protein